MIKIDGNGFIADDFLSTKELPKETNVDLFRILMSLNSFAEELKSDFIIKQQKTPKEKQMVITLVLFIRIIEIVQTVLILVSHGVREDLNSMFRIFLDAYFVFANCCSHEDFIESYFLTDLPNRLKLMNAASKHDSELFKQLNEYATDEIRNELDKIVKGEKLQSLSSYLFADKAGCTHMYDSMYRITSSSIHTTPRCLDHYVEADEVGNITVIKHKPDAETSDRVVYDTSYHFIKVINGICELFEIDKKDEITKFENDLKSAGKVFEDS